MFGCMDARNAPQPQPRLASSLPGSRPAAHRRPPCYTFVSAARPPPLPSRCSPGRPASGQVWLAGRHIRKAWLTLGGRGALSFVDAGLECHGPPPPPPADRAPRPTAAQPRRQTWHGTASALHLLLLLLLLLTSSLSGYPSRRGHDPASASECYFQPPHPQLD